MLSMAVFLWKWIGLTVIYLCVYVTYIQLYYNHNTVLLCVIRNILVEILRICTTSQIDIGIELSYITIPKLMHLYKHISVVNSR